MVYSTKNIFFTLAVVLSTASVSTAFSPSFTQSLSATKASFGYRFTTLKNAPSDGSDSTASSGVTSSTQSNVLQYDNAAKTVSSSFDPFGIQAKEPANSFTQTLAAPQRYTVDDWFNNLMSLPKSLILRNISKQLFVATGWACLVTFLHQYEGLTWDVSPLPHSLMSSALGLLLVFRTNASYDRFWEARKLWGSLTNDLRNLSRVGKMVLPRESHIMYTKFLMLFPYVLMFHLQRRPVDIKLVKDILLQEYEPLHDIEHLPALRTQKMQFGTEREKFRYDDIENTIYAKPASSLTEPGRFISPEQKYNIKTEETIHHHEYCPKSKAYLENLAQEIIDDPNPPAYVSTRLTELIDDAFDVVETGIINNNIAERSKISDANKAEFARQDMIYRLEIQQNHHRFFVNKLSSLIDILGACERILLTPVPLSYSRHTSRFLTLYIFSLPFVMAPTLHLLTPVFTCLICWALSSIEEIGHFIEDPFNVTIRDDGEEVFNLTLGGYVAKQHSDFQRYMQLTKKKEA